jgi:hypothetical protein
MPWGAAAAAAVVGGSIIQGNKAAGAARDAANAQREAGQQAAEMQKFRPVGITTGFGSSEFTQGPYGVESAKYTLTPEMQAIRDRRIAEATSYDPTQLGQYAQPLYGAGQQLFGLANQLIPTDTSRMSSPEAQALANQYRFAQQGLMPTSFQTGATPEAMALAQQFRQTGQGYLAQSPEEARAEYMRTQQAVLAPGRAAEEARLATANYGRGTGGLGVQTGTGTAPSNPLAQALFNARGQQDLQLAAQAEQAAQQRQAFGLSNISQGLTAQQQSEATQRANMLQNLGLSLDFGTQGLRSSEAGTQLARERFAEDLRLGSGLFGTGGELLGQVPRLTSAGYGPLQTQLGLAGSIEEMGQQALGLGLQVGGQNAAAGGRAGQSLLESGIRASQTQQAANSWSPWGTALQGVGQSYMGGIFGSRGGGGSTSTYTGPSYGTNPNFNNSWFDTMSYD